MQTNTYVLIICVFSAPIYSKQDLTILILRNQTWQFEILYIFKDDLPIKPIV
jgi:hypothetical protein